DLRHLGLDLCQGRIGVVVELQVHGDGAQALGARRLQVVDAVGARNHALERYVDEATHEVRARAHVHRGHGDDGDIAARILAHAERADRLDAGNQDDQIDDHGENRPADEEIGKSHQLSCGRGEGLLPGCTELLTFTVAPVRSLNTPDVTI